MKYILLLIMALSTAAFSAAEKPNIIVIFTDDLGWADLGTQGVRKDVRTPNLDLLAAGGLRATSGYVTSPQCVPSRAGLLTGRTPSRFGVESNGSSLEGFDAEETIASRLKKAGYATGMTGKWHLGTQNKIVTHGFDDVFCNQGQGAKAWANFDFEGKTTKGGYIDSPLYHLEANTAAACTFIKRHKEQPFFFYLAYRAPHPPFDATPKYLERFPGEMPERRRQCLAMISAVDDGVGQVMESLRNHGLESNTLIFFMGDNGAALHVLKEDIKPITAGGWGGSINEPMNGEKGMLTEGGIREPWLAYWKGRIPAGQVYEHPVISCDVAATAVALAGLPHDPVLDGVNLLPFFTGETKAAPHERIYWRWVDQAAVREGKWKLLVGGQRSFLYDLEADPGEKRNLLADQPELAKALRTKLDTWAQELKPAGLSTKGMAKVWESYYDYYLDGKPAPAQNLFEKTEGDEDPKKRRKQKAKNTATGTDESE
jgi:arylsulfatase A-like enzyme